MRDISMVIKHRLVDCKLSEAALAKKVGYTPQGFNRKMKAGKFCTDDLQKIAAALDCHYEGSFIPLPGTPGGERV
jgi:hypothetical protein